MLRRNILIFHAGALGDFVLSWPLAIGLGRVFAQSRIIFVTHASKGQLAEKVLRLESSDIESGWHPLFADGAELKGRPASLLAGAQAIYSFLSPTENWLSNVSRLNPAAKTVVISPRPTEDFSGHASQWLLEQLREHPVERAATEQMLRSIADRGIGFNRTGGPDVLIHPGSGSKDKCWPMERFVELGRRLRESGQNVRFVVGEVEQERWTAGEMQALATVGPVRSCSTYLELLGEFATASVFVGNDSGPGHLAGIVGVPVVSIFGTTDARVWKALGPRVRVVSGAEMNGISVNEVLKGVRGWLVENATLDSRRSTLDVDGGED